MRRALYSSPSKSRYGSSGSAARRRLSASSTVVCGRSAIWRHPPPPHPGPALGMAGAVGQLLSFLAVAARARIDVIEYRDDAEGEMPEDDPPMRITRITLRPQIVVGDDLDEARVRHLVEVAHRECFIASSLKTDVVIEPEIMRR